MCPQTVMLNYSIMCYKISTNSALVTLKTFPVRGSLAPMISYDRTVPISISQCFRFVEAYDQLMRDKQPQGPRFHAVPHYYHTTAHGGARA